MALNHANGRDDAGFEGSLKMDMKESRVVRKSHPETSIQRGIQDERADVWRRGRPRSFQQAPIRSPQRLARSERKDDAAGSP